MKIIPAVITAVSGAVVHVHYGGTYKYLCQLTGLIVVITRLISANSALISTTSGVAKKAAPEGGGGYLGALGSEQHRFASLGGEGSQRYDR